MTRARLARLAALAALWAAVELLERINYAAGAGAVLEDQADDVEPFDVSDVLAAHTCVCCRTGAEAGPPVVLVVTEA